MSVPPTDTQEKIKDVWGNKKVSFPTADASTPSVARTFTPRKLVWPGCIGTNPVPAFAANDPDTANFPDAYLTSIDPSPGDRERQNLTLGYETLPGTLLTSYEYDPETFAKVTVTRQRVLASAVSPPADGVAGTELSVQAINKVVSLVTNRTTSTTQPTRNEYHSNEYQFPSRIYAVTFDVAVATNGLTLMTLNFQKTSGRRLRTMERVAVSYATTAPALNSTVTIYNFPIVDIVYSGIFIPTIEEPRVLTLGFTLTYAAGSGSILWPDFTETLEVPATSVTPTEYDALIGTEILVGGQTSPWRFNMFRQELIYTKVQA
jgi:hypothetical protein